jgi:uncharacterized membrane protein
LGKFAVSALGAEPVWSTAVGAFSVVLFSPGSDVLDSSYEDDDGTSSWNTQAC